MKTIPRFNKVKAAAPKPISTAEDVRALIPSGGITPREFRALAGIGKSRAKLIQMLPLIQAVGRMDGGKLFPKTVGNAGAPPMTDPKNGADQNPYETLLSPAPVSYAPRRALTAWLEEPIAEPPLQVDPPQCGYPRFLRIQKNRRTKK